MKHNIQNQNFVQVKNGQITITSIGPNAEIIAIGLSLMFISIGVAALLKATN